MTPTLLDHFLVTVLVVALPIEGALEFRVLVGALKRGEAGARSRALLRTIVLQWGLAMALLAGWRSAGRPWEELGLTVPGGWRAGVGLVAVAGTAWLVWAQRRGVRRLSPERRRRLVERSGDMLLLLPTTGAERRVFAATAVTAGICEELLCRGFMFWYLGNWMGPWTAVLVASVSFGIAHVYQGAKGAVRTGVVALVLGSLYVLSGSIVWPMAAHALVDLGAGMLGDLLGGLEPARVEAMAPTPGAGVRV